MSDLDKPDYTNDAEIRKDILDTAKKYVCNDRNKQYGSPEDNFTLIAERWTLYLQQLKMISSEDRISPTMVSVMMTDFKLARLTGNPLHKDSWVDAAGYIACGAGIILKEQTKNEQPPL